MGFKAQRVRVSHAFVYNVVGINKIFAVFFGKTASMHEHSIDFVVITKGNTVGIVEKIE